MFSVAGVAVLALVAGMAGGAEPRALGVTAIPLLESAGARDDWVIYLDGYIDNGAAGRFEGVVTRQRITRAVVYLNSPGGSLIASMELGRVVREHHFDTDVGRPAGSAGAAEAGVCYSACPFAYAGGIARALTDGSVLGVHLAENRVPVPDEQAFERRVSADTRSYLEEMGVTPGLVKVMASAPHDSIRVLSRAEARRLDLVNQR